MCPDPRQVRHQLSGSLNEKYNGSVSPKVMWWSGQEKLAIPVREAPAPNPSSLGRGFKNSPPQKSLAHPQAILDGHDQFLKISGLTITVSITASISQVADSSSSIFAHVHKFIIHPHAPVALACASGRGRYG